MISGLVLAAGAGRQLGTPQAEALLGGRRLIDRAVFTLRAGGCEDVLAVVRSGEVSVDGAKTIVNADCDGGIGSSIQAGLAQLHPDTEAVLITRVDLPGVAPTEVKAAIGWYRNGASIIVTRRGGERSHPVLIGRRWLRQFAESATETQPGRSFFARNFEDIDFLDYPEPMADIETLDDLADAQRRWGAS